MSKTMYNWIAKYMFWQKDFSFPFKNISIPIEQKTMLFVGHRGSPDNYPENTTLSFDKAIEEGGGAIEMDVRKSVDGVFYIMHDATVDRTTDGTGVAEELEWSYLSTLDAGSWKGLEFANREDTKVPSLDTILEKYKGQDIFLWLHLKLFGIQTYYEVIDIVTQKGMLNQVVFFAHSGGLEAIKQYNNQCFVVNDGFSVHSNFEVMLTQAIDEEWNAMSIYAPEVNEPMLNGINENGMYTQASFLLSNYETETQKMIDLGVNFVLGNDTQKMVQVANQNNIVQIVPSDLSS